MKSLFFILSALMGCLFLTGGCRSKTVHEKKTVNLRDTLAIKNTFFSIDDVSQVVNNIMNDKIEEIYENASDTLKTDVAKGNFVSYFSLIDKFYGKLEYAEDYKVTGNKHYIGIDLKAKFEKIDTCELRTVFYRENQDTVGLIMVKVVPLLSQRSYLIDSLCQVAKIFVASKNIRGLYGIMTDDFKQKNSYALFKSRLTEHFNHYTDIGDFTLTRHVITIFDRDNSGVEATYEFKSNPGEFRRMFLTYRLVAPGLKLSGIDFSVDPYRK